MSPHALDLLRARIQRALVAAQRQAADGFSQSHVLDDGVRHSYTVTGVKSPEQFEDELLTLFVWVWSLKDYLKNAYRSKNLDPQLVEEVVNCSLSLQYVADIANRAKHGSLRESRSGHFAALVDVGITVPQSAVSAITVGAYNVGVDVCKPEEVILRGTVQPQRGAALDAFAVLTEGISAWETHVLYKIAEIIR